MSGKELHCVIGGNGASARATITALKKKKLPVRSIARNNKPPDTDFKSGDTLELQSLLTALEGASHVYACMGFPYRTKIWQKVWPQSISNIIKACQEHNAKLIFLDNIYMYGPAPLQIPITESHRQEPDSQKGKIRKFIADQVLQAHQTGTIQAVIGRAPDFYGPNVSTSIINVILEGSIKGKRPVYWPKAMNHKHSHIHINDLGESLVCLAQASDTFGDVWHLPVAENPLTIFEFLEKIITAAKFDLQVKPMPRWLKFILELLIPDFRESNEMSYQYRSNYIFDSTKFLKRFPDFKVTSYEDGIQEIAKYLSDFDKTAHLSR